MDFEGSELAPSPSGMKYLQNSNSFFFGKNWASVPVFLLEAKLSLFLQQREDQTQALELSLRGL